MKAIILAAGRGTRMKPLTDTTPKPLISIAGKPILEHNLEHIYTQVDEIIIVIKYLWEKIKSYFWDNFKGTKITYFEQWGDKWTGWAIRWINFKWDFLLINWDSIFEKNDFDSLMSLKWYGCLTREMPDPSKYWVFEKKENWNALRVIEKPQEFYGNTTNVWAYKFSDILFKINNSIPLSSRWEYEITDSINDFCEQENFQLLNMQWQFIDIGAPWDILDANSYFLKKLNSSDIKWTIEQWVTIKWNIILEEWAVLKSWTYIEWNCYIWKDSKIGPNCYIRWESVIWSNCHIGNAVEIKNTSMWDNSNAWHLTYLWDSIVWNNVNFWWGFIVANLRHDWKNMRCMIDWKLVDTWKIKLWVIVWDNAKIWIKSMAYPARVIESGAMLLPWTIVK